MFISIQQFFTLYCYLDQLLSNTKSSSPLDYSFFRSKSFKSCCLWGKLSHSLECILFFLENGYRFIGLNKFNFIEPVLTGGLLLIPCPIRHTREAYKIKVRAWPRNSWNHCSLFFITSIRLLAFFFNVFPSKVFAMRLL